MNERKQHEQNLFDARKSPEHPSNSNTEIDNLLGKGIEAIAEGETLSALYCFEKALSLENRPTISSYFAFCIAKERGHINKAILLCTEAIRKEPQNPLHYLNLGRIYLLSDKKTDAIEIFRKGLKYKENQQIVDELIRLGTRKPPVIPFLKRNNPINKYLGIILKKLRFR